MRRLLQHILGGGVTAGLLCLGLLTASGEGGAAAPAAPADLKGYTETLPGTKVTFDMVAIPEGTFTMGSSEAEKGRSPDEGPQHPVRLKAFWMGKCVVSWDEYDVYRKELGVENPDANDKVLSKDPTAITGPTPPYVDETYGHPREGHPAICMTHHAAMEYCAWLSKKTGKTYRLPTEAEWEYAARAGTQTAYFFGDDPAKLDDYAWFEKNSNDHTHPVLSKKPNPWGLYNMYGNVMQWCVDQYDPAYYQKFPINSASLQPVNIPGPNRFPHVARGGCWSDESPQLRSAARRGSDKSWIKFDPQKPQSVWWLTNWDVVGFRVVRPLEEQENLKGLRSKVTRQSR